MLTLAAAMLVSGALGLLTGSLPRSTSERAALPWIPSPTEPILTGGSDRSLAGLQQRLKVTPKDWRSWAVLGLAYVQKARVTADPSYYSKAKGSLMRSQTLHRTANVEAFLGRGALALALHRFQDGLRWGEEARRTNPYSSSAHGILGDALAELGRYEEAFATYQRMVDLRPNLASYARASYTRELQGDVAGAVSAMKLALQAASAPEDRAFAAFHLGELAFNHGHSREAARWYGLSRTLAPGYSPPGAGLAKVAWAQGRLGRAIRLYHRVVLNTPLPEHAAALGDLQALAGRRKMATGQYALVRAEQRLFEAAGVNVDLELALFDADHGRPRAALEAAKAEWKRRHSVHVADALGWALFRNGRPLAASRYARLALRLGYRNALFHFHAGMIDLALGHETRGRRELQTALAINPHFSILHSSTAARKLRRLEGKP